MYLKYELAVPSACRKLMEKLQSSGFAAYAVGGSIRDSIMKRGEPEDWDIATAARPEDVMKLFPNAVLTGLKYGTVSVMFDGQMFEVTTFRKDEGYTDARHPDRVVFVDSIEEDLLRRDFTINALAYDAISNTLIDTVGGLDDINNRIIRAVGNPETRFNEDRLRMLRAIRFATVLGFSIEDNTLAAISSGRSFIHMVAWERIREEFSRILTSHSPSRGLEMMRVTGILGEILPELPTGTEQVCRECGSGTVYEHSLMVCDRVSNDISLRLAALLHEIEQWAEMENCTYDVNDANDMDNVDDADDGNDRDDSPKKSAELALNVLTRYRFPSAVINKVCLLIKFHTTGYSGEWTDGDVRRFVSRIGRNNIDDFFKFKKADFLAQECQGKEGLRSFYEFEKRIRMLVDDATVLTVEGLDIDGHDLRQIGFEEGPVIGEMLKLALDLVIESPEKNRKDVLMNYIANHIKNIKKAGEDQS